MPDMCKYVKTVESGKIANPGTKAYKTISDATKDKLILARLQFALSVCKQISPFLAGYQNDSPMVPFLGEDLYDLQKSVMNRFIKSEIMATLKTGEKLLTLKIADNENHVNTKKVDIGFSAEKILKGALEKKNISEKQEFEFRSECKSCLLAFSEKLSNKSPLRYNLVHHLSFLNPKEMVQSKNKCIEKMKKCLVCLNEINRVSEQDCDDIVRQYEKFLNDVIQKDKVSFENFDKYNGRLDTFLYNRNSKERTYDKFWNVCEMFLLLSSGQASVERGFSVKRQIEEIKNMHETMYTSLRQICDHVKTVGGIQNVLIDKPLLLSVVSARQ